MDDLSRFCCLNSDCPAHGKRGAGNLTVTSRYGPRKERRMLRCSACKARFSERKGTPLFDSRLPPERAADVITVYNDPGLHRHLVGERGWAYDDFRDWLARALHRELLTDGSPG